MANTLINVGGLVASLLPLALFNKEQPDPNKMTQITLGVGSNPNADGSVPHIAVFDAKGGRITQFKGNKNGHIGGDKEGRTTGYYLNNDQNGKKPAKPEYVSVVMHENDGICLAAVAAAGEGVQWAWTGDIGYTCGAQWYPSQYTMGNYNQPIRCVWLDANHDNGIIAKGLSLHIRDFSGEAGMLSQYKEDEGRLCQNSARMTFHPDILPDSFPTFFNPPLKYMRETNADDPTKPSTAGALEKPNQGRDRQTRAYPDGTDMNSRKLRRQQSSNLQGQRKLKIRGIKNLHPERLTVSHMKGHSAKELCLDKMSLGPDFVSVVEGAFCDMATATWWPLCTAVQTINCFDLETKTTRTIYSPLTVETFATEILVVIAQFKILDTAFTFSWDRPPPSLATAYLERRILNERPGGAAYLVWIRRVAKQLSQETDDGRDECDYIRQLCPLVSGSDRWIPGRFSVYEKIEPAPKQLCNKIECAQRGFCDDHHFDDDVFTAALYTQTLPVIARWISSGKRGRELLISSYLFGVSLQHASMHGNQEVLAAMLDLGIEVYKFHHTRTCILRRVAETGNMDLTQFIWDFEAVQHPWVCKRKARPSYLSDNARTVAELNTPRREIFDWIMEKRRIHLPDKRFGEKEFTRFLHESAHMGWVDMTAYYLALGALVDGIYLPNCRYSRERPLVGAARNGHKEVVKLLLNHGADTSQPALETAVEYVHFDVFYLLLEHGAETGRALAVAVAKGYRSIVNVLLERGGHTKEHLQSLLPRAIETEDKAIFQTLAKHVEIDDATRAECAKVAEENGLESMAELL
ncbi:hypothetical protein yc1106_03161 [Curvularia clavata]|uniref:Uncharacterized protein n=1 Tax=Curvularia clavata TaxID=95742 RepID=A0A9Q8Z577_CURCL|nr:hypothetical protein yc1106_03161 [Curvularia clavata]